VVDDSCECAPSDELYTNPLCQNATGAYEPLQRFARATPGVRQLTLLRELGRRGVVTSICHDGSAGASSPGFGYKPAVDAMLRASRRRLEQPPQ
jgi:hypothetical protein